MNPVFDVRPMSVCHKFFFAQSTNVTNKITLGSSPDHRGQPQWLEVHPKVIYAKKKFCDELTNGRTNEQMEVRKDMSVQIVI